MVEWISTGVNIFFFMDVVLTFMTTKLNKKTGVEITEWRKIAMAYVTHPRFYVDVICAIPLDSLESKWIELLNMLKITKIN